MAFRKPSVTSVGALVDEHTRLAAAGFVDVINLASGMFASRQGVPS